MAFACGIMELGVISIKYFGGITHEKQIMIHPSTLSVGTTVTTNTVVGYVGSSGNSSGNHLHMTMLTDGTIVKKSKTLDPMMFYGDLNLVCTQGTD